MGVGAGDNPPSVSESLLDARGMVAPPDTTVVMAKDQEQNSSSTIS